jgi:hypothetical protein
VRARGHDDQPALHRRRSLRAGSGRHVVAATSLGNGPAVLVASPPAAWLATIPGAQWVWKAAQVANPVVADTATFYQSFNTAALKPVTLEIAADDGYAVWLNGRLVVDSLGAINPTTFTRVAHYTLPQTALLVGGNMLLVAVRNAPSPTATSPDQNPAGLLYALTIGTP